MPAKPDPQRRCDEMTCIVSDDQPWTIFEGCWYSFHIACLAGKQHCKICKAHLEMEFDKLVSVANATLLGDQEEHLENDNDQLSDDNNDDLDDMGLCSKETNFDAALSNVNSRLLGLRPKPPPVLPATQDNNVSSGITQSNNRKLRPPHCNKCKHSKIGHGRSNNSKCPSLSNVSISDLFRHRFSYTMHM